jgi:hypothetical protein
VHYAIDTKRWQCISLILTSLVTQYSDWRNPHTKRQVEHLVRGDLCDTYRHGMIFIATTLDKWWHGWRIRHPQAATQVRTIRTYSPIFGSLPKVYPVLGAWVGSQRKRPHCAFPTCGAVLRLPDPPILSQVVELFPMIYTFLILRSRTCRLAELRRIRTISTFAQNEAQARAALVGLPLVFMSRTPSNKGVAA